MIRTGSCRSASPCMPLRVTSLRQEDSMRIDIPCEPVPGSLWHDTLPDGELEHRRAPLAGTTEVDVAVVGGVFAGLWPAYSRARRDPGLRIVVLEREFAGFGASGRNGGWLSGLLPISWEAVAAGASPEAAGAGGAAPGGGAAGRGCAGGSVDEALRGPAAEGIDAHAVKGGYLCLATSE